MTGKVLNIWYNACCHRRYTNTPKGSRTPVTWMRTMYPRPLDDGGSSNQNKNRHQADYGNSGGRNRTYDLRLMNPAL